MKSFLSNPARIGDAALATIYKSCQEKNWTREVTFSKSEPALSEIFLNGQHKNSLKLWGIEPGLVTVEIANFEQGSMAKFLSKIDREKLKKFSHVILIQSWSSKAPYVYSDSETVQVYRLTPYGRMVIDAQ